MKWTIASFCLIICLLIQDANAQSYIPSTGLDGKYYLMTPERSPKGGTTQEMLVQYVERNGQKMLVAAACEDGCTPMVFSYQPAPSESLGVPVFYNSFGYYMISYEGDSFLSVIPDTQLGKDIWRSIRYSNFYSKDAEKSSVMTSDKISEIAISLSNQAMGK
ncbi:MAG: hypothetical protein R8N23_08565 [Reichenbachiella sp.]|uniref:hypothetical protein n=1 Tax=Reichenbachiella sp. TaxID=2184521 RepID=UPI00296749DE|nr:hypothetical protein [Reichenbachiella sp.]MDW3209905.1 hypothetical protein [Reichenbachiella sp.]